MDHRTKCKNSDYNKLLKGNSECFTNNTLFIRTREFRDRGRKDDANIFRRSVGEEWKREHESDRKVLLLDCG